MIRSFKNRPTEDVFQRRFTAKLPHDIQRLAKIKLDIVHVAGALDDLRVPPGNRLEALKGGRKGQYSIRINDQWRICFSWRGGDAFDLEIVDYH